MPSLNPAKYARFINKVRRLRAQANGRPMLPLAEQLREIYSLLQQSLLEPEEYFLYELYDPERPFEEKAEYVGRRAYVLIDRAFNPDKETGVLNKLVFKVYAERFGIPVPKLYGVFDPGFGYTADQQPLRTLEQLRSLINSIPGDFLLKPMGADKGNGIRLCRRADNDRIESVGEGLLTLDQLHQEMLDSHHNLHTYIPDSWVIEERVRQHPFLDCYTDTCTQTLRIATFITEAREIEIIVAIQKIARGQVPIDNVGSGGMAAKVSLTGELSPAYRLEPLGTTRFDHHPETGAPITGAVLPNFDIALEVARRAQAAVPQMRSIAWDIALTETGATIIEGNSYWGWEGMQRNVRHGLLQGEFGREVRRLIAAGEQAVLSRA